MSQIIVNTGEDRIALMLGRAQIRAEMLQARVEELEAAAKESSDEPEQRRDG